MLVTKLDYEENYWFEVQVIPINYAQYGTDFMGPQEGKQFYSQFSENTQGYGYTSKDAYSTGSGTMVDSSKTDQKSTYEYQKKAGNTNTQSWFVILVLVGGILIFLV